jgi:nucleoside-triphosphatase THEP1
MMDARPGDPRGRLFVLTGPVHSGKTTFLKKAAADWNSRGIAVGGFVCEARREPSGIQGYDLTDLGEGTSIPFLRRAGDAGGPAAGPYRLVRGGLEKAGEILVRDARRDILIVDEFGPLELAGGGIRASFESVLAGGARCLTVVRLSLIGRFREIMRGRNPEIFRLDDPEATADLVRAVASLKETGGR